MKWLRPEPTRPYMVSECGKWMLNKGGEVYMLVRLGKPDRGAWKDAVIVKVGSRRECEEAADEQNN